MKEKLEIILGLFSLTLSVTVGMTFAIGGIRAVNLSLVLIGKFLLGFCITLGVMALVIFLASFARTMIKEFRKTRKNVTP